MGVTITEGAGPEVWGAFEAAAELGCLVSNLGRLRGLPAPIADLNCGRIWLADEIRAYKATRDRDQAAGRNRGRFAEVAEPGWVGTARALRAQGLAWDAVSREVGIPVSTVHRWVNNRG